MQAHKMIKHVNQQH